MVKALWFRVERYDRVVAAAEVLFAQGGEAVQMKAPASGDSDLERAAPDYGSDD